MKSDAAILILAAGAASRMRGRDKLLEPVSGQPLLRLLAERALATGRRVAVSLPDPPGARGAALQGLDVQLLPVPDARLGQSESLKAGIRALADSPRVLCLLGDLPELTTAHLNAVLDAPMRAPDALVWRGMSQDGQPGHPVLIDAGLFPQVDALTGDVGARAVIRAAGDRVHLVPFADDAATLDLDTPEDWAAWRAAKAGNDLS